jgi:hypothetical protein
MAEIKIGGFGKLSTAPNDDAPLLVVFGGKNVDGRESGLYMWDFMSKVQNKYHIFVAVNQHVNGLDSYNKLMETVTSDDHHLAPAQQFLYLFSGGWLPGEHLLGHLLRHKEPIPFSWIYLVDIWMRDSVSFDFYTHLPNKVSTPVSYVHTLHGAVNDKARDALANSVGSQNEVLVKPQTKDEDSMVTHMSTNTVAVGLLP